MTDLRARAAPAEQPATPGPLRIGPLSVDPPVVLAPMAGVTDGPFRGLCSRFGAGLYVSEMITARAVVERNEKTLGMLRFDGSETTRSVQLYGTAPTTMGEAVRFLVGEVGVDHIDMNFGCPVPKVTRKGGGAALPVRRVLLREIVRAAVRAAGDVPVTVKFRMGVDDLVLTYLETGRIAADEGAAAIALHARTAEQLYSGQARWDAIAALKAEVTGIPVLGNGDVWEASDALAMVAETGCDGVVIGRGCLGRPWLFRDLADAFAGRPVQPPPRLGEVAAVMREHAERLVDWYGETSGMKAFRKHAGWYFTGYPVGSELRRRGSMVSTLADLDAILAELDPDATIRDNALRAPRGHTNGPRPVHLPDGWLALRDDPTPPKGAEILASGG
ncbi:MAG TPA: tRNA dihydrouridine synthase DusB [Acidimicrobiales bacterium]|nr:tRNA dihydrouridine synthase DusB [Acidimicrobiales bacterium]